MIEKKGIIMYDAELWVKDDSLGPLGYDPNDLYQTLFIMAYSKKQAIELINETLKKSGCPLGIKSFQIMLFEKPFDTGPKILIYTDGLKQIDFDTRQAVYINDVLQELLVKEKI